MSKLKELWAGLEKPWKLYEAIAPGDVKHWTKTCSMFEVSIDQESDGSFAFYVLVGSEVVASTQLSGREQEEVLIEAANVLGEFVKEAFDATHGWGFAVTRPAGEIRLKQAFSHNERLYGLDTEGVLYEYKIGEGWDRQKMGRI